MCRKISLIYDLPWTSPLEEWCLHTADGCHFLPKRRAPNTGHDCRSQYEVSCPLRLELCDRAQNVKWKGKRQSSIKAVQNCGSLYVSSFFKDFLKIF